MQYTFNPPDGFLELARYGINAKVYHVIRLFSIREETAAGCAGGPMLLVPDRQASKS